jgi:hypothetical protein
MAETAKAFIRTAKLIWDRAKLADAYVAALPAPQARCFIFAVAAGRRRIGRLFKKLRLLLPRLSLSLHSLSITPHLLSAQCGIRLWPQQTVQLTPKKLLGKLSSQTGGP